jgi:hypothetical protein
VDYLRRELDTSGEYITLYITGLVYTRFPHSKRNL